MKNIVCTGCNLNAPLVIIQYLRIYDYTLDMIEIHVMSNFQKKENILFFLQLNTLVKETVKAVGKKLSTFKTRTIHNPLSLQPCAYLALASEMIQFVN